MPTALKKIAISGMGCCSAAGHDLAHTWDNLWQGILPVPGPPPFACRQPQPVFAYDGPLACSAPFASTALEDANRTIRLTLRAIQEAMAMAAISPTDLGRRRVGIALGTTVRCHFHDDDYFLAWQAKKTPEPEPIRRFLNENLASAIQQILQVHGPATVVTNACASGTDAIGLAAGWLAADLCDLVICGGADELSRLAFHGFASLLLSADTPCQPFDKRRSGLNLGEGAGILILENTKALNTRNHPPQGWLRGYGAGADGYHPTAPHPEGRGLQHAIRTAMARAGVGVDDIALINGHGTGTPANDLAETTALAQMGFTSTPLVSIKGATGHTLGGAGAIEAVLTLRALQSGATSGTPGCQQPDPQLPRAALRQNERADLSGSIGLSHSLAFGGGNGALILEAAL